MEALELGTDLAIFDEDSTASNFLVRDTTMQKLVPDEPITPLAVRARDLVASTGVTIVLVCGSSSAFLAEADVVVQMERYHMHDVTAKAKALVDAAPPARREPSVFTPGRARRAVRPASLEPHGKVSTRGLFQVQYGDEVLDLHAVPQLVSTSQTRAIETALRQWAQGQHQRGAGGGAWVGVRALVDALEASINEEGLDVLQEHGRLDGFLARPRRVDLGAAGMYEHLTQSTACGTPNFSVTERHRHYVGDAKGGKSAQWFGES